MSNKNVSNVYDDDNIPEVDLPQNRTDATDNITNRMDNSKATGNTTQKAAGKTNYNVEPLPESTRPRKDGPGGA